MIGHVGYFHTSTKTYSINLDLVKQYNHVEKYFKLRLLGSNFTKTKDKMRSKDETNIHMNIIGAYFFFSPKLVLKK